MGPESRRYCIDVLAGPVTGRWEANLFMEMKVALLDLLGAGNWKERRMKEDFGSTRLAVLDMAFCMIF